MHSFSDYDSYPSDPTILHGEMVGLARWLCARKLIDEEKSEYNVSDFSPMQCAAAWEHINAGRLIHWINYGPDPNGIEDFVEFVGFKDNSRRLAKWLKVETAQANYRQQSAVYLGDGKVQIGNEPPLKLPPQFAVVLEGLVASRAADTDDLEKFGGGPKKLREMLKHKQFACLAPFIVLPGKRGFGGYRTWIQDGRK
jgi:hypothetical protein